MRSLCCVVLALALFASVSCVDKYQCSFENAVYKLPHEPGTPRGYYTWGQDVEPVELDSIKELHHLVSLVDKLRSNYFGRAYYDNTISYQDIFYHMTRLIKANEVIITPLLEAVSAIFQPRKLMPDSLGFLAQFMDELALTNLRDSMFFAVGGVPRDLTEIEELGDQPPEVLKNEYLVGVIKYSIDGFFGYIILDLDYPRIVSPTAFEGDVPKGTYDLIGDAKKYIQVSEDKSEVIYVGKPLCSVIQTRNRMLLMGMNKVQFIKYNPDFTRLAYFIGRLNPRGEERMYTVGHADVDENGKTLYVATHFNELAQVRGNKYAMAIFFGADQMAHRAIQQKFMSQEFFMTMYIKPHLAEWQRLSEQILHNIDERYYAKYGRARVSDYIDGGNDSDDDGSKHEHYTVEDEDDGDFLDDSEVDDGLTENANGAAQNGTVADSDAGYDTGSDSVEEVDDRDYSGTAAVEDPAGNVTAEGDVTDEAASNVTAAGDNTDEAV